MQNKTHEYICLKSTVLRHVFQGSGLPNLLFKRCSLRFLKLQLPKYPKLPPWKGPYCIELFVFLPIRFLLDCEWMSVYARVCNLIWLEGSKGFQLILKEQEKYIIFVIECKQHSVIIILRAYCLQAFREYFLDCRKTNVL